MKAEAVSRVENGQVRVTEWRFAAGAETGWHRHEFDYVVVPLTDGMLRIVAGEEESTTELKRGVAYFRKAGVQHNVINAGENQLAFVEVELVEHPGCNKSRSTIQASGATTTSKATASLPRTFHLT